MPNKCINLGGVSIETPEVDLVFEFEGQTTYMEFHRYCGPNFYTLKSEKEIQDIYDNPDIRCVEHENWIYPDDSERFKPLWNEFDKWMEEYKQTDQYKRDRS